MTKPQCCSFCGTSQKGLTVWNCSGCNLAQYCNKACQKKHWHSHNVICNAAQTLSKMSDKNVKPSTFVTHLTPKQSSLIAKLAGKRCTINCKLDGISSKALWDTGAQVSIISERFPRRHFPSAKLRNISELLDCELDLTAANGTPIPYSGFIKLTFKHEEDTIFVPFLVTTEDIPCQLLDII